MQIKITLPTERMTISEFKEFSEKIRIEHGVCALDSYVIFSTKILKLFPENGVMIEINGAKVAYSQSLPVDIVDFVDR